MTPRERDEPPIPWFQNAAIVWEIADKVFKMLGWAFLFGAMYVYYLRSPSYLTSGAAMALGLLWFMAGSLQIREIFDRHDWFARKVERRTFRQWITMLIAYAVFYLCAYGLFVALSTVAEDVAAGLQLRR